MKKKVALALQGGGAHGAFTWGILEKLYEEDIFDIRGICGTSAGAMNAAIAIHGYQKGGSEGAVELLEKFWKRVSQYATLSSMMPEWMYNSMNPDAEYSPSFQMFNAVTSMYSPYDFNPFDINPLANTLNDLINFEVLRTSECKLFACATNVMTGKPKIFETKEITAQMLMASACLPALYKAVEIDGQHYWDGGYCGNPSIYPLIDDTDSDDILLIKVNPFTINKLPTGVKEIQDRINEISFNSSLLAEMRMIVFKDRILNMGYDIRGKLRKINFHEISADSEMEKHSFVSKFNASWRFLNDLRMKGRATATQWIETNYDMVGEKSSLNMRDYL